MPGAVAQSKVSFWHEGTASAARRSPAHLVRAELHGKSLSRLNDRGGGHDPQVRRVRTGTRHGCPFGQTHHGVPQVSDRTAGAVTMQDRAVSAGCDVSPER